MRGSSLGYLIRTGVKSVFRNRLMSFAAIGVLVACMILIGAAILFSMNINSIVEFTEEQNEIVPCKTRPRAGKRGLLCRAA